MSDDDIVIPGRADRAEFDRLEIEEKHERRRNRLLIALIFLVAIPVAIWAGSLINASQETATNAQVKTEQAQVEKYNLAQQVAAACAAPEADRDPTEINQLCKDAATIVRAGPQGAQGVPGVTGPQGAQGLQGIQGIPGFDGKDGAAGKDGLNGLNGKDGAQGQPGANGKDGATGPAGPAGTDGKDGSIGPAGADGKDGQPPFSWVVYNEGGQVIETCTRTATFDPQSPTYTCSNN